VEPRDRDRAVVDKPPVSVHDVTHAGRSSFNPLADMTSEPGIHPPRIAPTARRARAAERASDGRGRLSIGALARATGIPVETLRTWESRYGFPHPERKPSGHRTYPAQVVPRLRLMAEALARGHRACEAVGASDAGLAVLLRASPTPRATAARTASAAGPPSLEPLLAAVAALDGESLRTLLVNEWARHGPLAFLDECVAPLVRRVGEAWANGALAVRHEHFLTERLGDVLRTLRLPFETREDQRPLVVFATLPGEPHGLGLQMAALVVAAAGCRTLLAGTDMPPEQILALAADVQARAVALSVSLATRGRRTTRHVARLRQRLPRRVHLIVGGLGAPPASAGVETVDGFAALEQWAARLLAR